MSPKKSAVATPKATRRYTNTRRTAQAAQTRADVLTAAWDAFSETGWSGTTIAAIAERAGVAVETIYSGFGSKKQLLMQAADAAVVGDAEPIPYWDRPEVQALGTGPLPDRMQRAVGMVAAQHERGAHVWRACTEAAAGDDEWQAWMVEKNDGRRLDTTRILGLIFGFAVDPVAVEVVMALFSAETYLFLTESSGWSRAQYEERMLAAALAVIRDRQPEL